LEISGYYLPWVDHLLDVVSTPAAIVAGTLMMASLTPDLDPLVQWTLAIAAGGGTAGLTKGLMNIIRGTSTAMSGGITNPFFSTLELIAATLLSGLAIAVPVLTGIGVLLLLGIAVRKFWMLLIPQPQTQDAEPPV
jgi:hypothetical protein